MESNGVDSSSLPLQVGVKVLLKGNEGKFLLVRRNPKKYPDMKPTWDIIGGRIHVNVPLFENLKREVKEEVGLNLAKEPRLVAAQDIIRPDKHVVRLTYVGEIDGQPVLDEDHVEFGWFTLDELRRKENLDSFFKEIIENHFNSLSS